MSCDRIGFKKPILDDTLVELTGRIRYIGNTSLKVNVEIFVEEMYVEKREKVVS